MCQEGRCMAACACGTGDSGKIYISSSNCVRLVNMCKDEINEKVACVCVCVCVTREGRDTVNISIEQKCLQLAHSHLYAEVR